MLITLKAQIDSFQIKVPLFNSVTKYLLKEQISKSENCQIEANAWKTKKNKKQL